MMEFEIEEDPLRCVIELADAPFEIGPFRRVWERFGGVWERSTADAYGFTVPLTGHGYALWVDPLGSRILSARLPVCYLDDWGDGGVSAGSDRATFDSAWARLSDRLRLLLGPPALEWRDADTVGYRAAVWSGAHGLLIAQQAAVDSEFGDEVCLAAESILLKDFAPFGTLARWLSDRSRSLHDRDGFPPVVE